MQYILTQEEYDKLFQNQKKTHEKTYVNLTEKQLQNLCTDICNNYICTKGWYKGKAWECILTVGDHEWYCDECVMQDICPYPNKHWSK